MPGRRLPAHCPGPEATLRHSQRAAEAAGGTKRPPAAAREALPKKSQTKGFLPGSPGTERGQHPGSPACGGVPGGRRRRSRPFGCSRAPLACASSPRASSGHSAAARDSLHPVPASFVGSGGHGAPRDQGPEPPGRPVSPTAGSNISYPQLLFFFFPGLQDAQNRSFRDRTIPCRQPKSSGKAPGQRGAARGRSGGCLQPPSHHQQCHGEGPAPSSSI